MYSTVVNIFVIPLNLIPSKPAIDNTVNAPVHKSSL